MRLRRYAKSVRALGWINLFVTVVGTLAVGLSSQELWILGASALWVGGVMAITEGVAWMIDKRAEQVVTR